MNPLVVLFFLVQLFFIRSSHQINFDLSDAGKDVPDIIERYIGKCETHEAITEDGYILTLFRIPRNKSKGVIMFQHPMMFDSKMWLLQGNESTAFIFWRAGYDVWLSNTRGTLYSKKHVSLKTTDQKFWNHSFHEIGLYDHHANIQHIKKISKVSQIIYVGHSMATTTSLVYASMRPEEAFNSVKLFVSLAPSCYFKHSLGSAAFTPFIPLFKKLTSTNSLLAYDSTHAKIIRSLPSSPMLEYFYAFFVISTCGGNLDNVNLDIFRTARAQFGSEMSWKVIDHYSQLISGNVEFRMYDYGVVENLKLYGSVKARLYPIENIKVPFFFVYGAEDRVNHPQDVEILYDKLPQKCKIHGKLKIEKYGHFSFHFEKDRIPKVYNKILELLKAI